MLHHLRRPGRRGAGDGAGPLESAEGGRGEPGLLETVGRGALGTGGLIAALVLAACSSTPQVAQAPAPAVVEQAEANQPVGSRTPEGEADLCKAGELQYLVGRHRNEIPVPVEVINRRVVCTTCPVTMDFSPYRMNIFYNAETELVEQVRCG